MHRASTFSIASNLFCFYALKLVRTETFCYSWVCVRQIYDISIVLHTFLKWIKMRRSPYINPLLVS